MQLIMPKYHDYRITLGEIPNCSQTIYIHLGHHPPTTTIQLIEFTYCHDIFPNKPLHINTPNVTQQLTPYKIMDGIPTPLEPSQQEYEEPYTNIHSKN